MCSWVQFFISAQKVYHASREKIWAQPQSGFIAFSKSCQTFCSGCWLGGASWRRARCQGKADVLGPGLSECGPNQRLCRWPRWCRGGQRLVEPLSSVAGRSAQAIWRSCQCRNLSDVHLLMVPTLVSPQPHWWKTREAVSGRLLRLGVRALGRAVSLGFFLPPSVAPDETQRISDDAVPLPWKTSRVRVLAICVRSTCW